MFADSFVSTDTADTIDSLLFFFVVVPFWLWSRRRGRFPIIRIGSIDKDELAEFNAWRAAQKAENTQLPGT